MPKGNRETKKPKQDKPKPAGQEKIAADVEAAVRRAALSLSRPIPAAPRHGAGRQCGRGTPSHTARADRSLSVRQPWRRARGVEHGALRADAGEVPSPWRQDRGGPLGAAPARLRGRRARYHHQAPNLLAGAGEGVLEPV